MTGTHLLATLCFVAVSLLLTGCSGSPPPTFEEPFAQPIDDLLMGVGFEVIGSTDVFDEADQSYPERTYVVEPPPACFATDRSCFVPDLRGVFEIDDLDSFGPGFEFSARRDDRSCDVSMTNVGLIDDPVAQLVVEELNAESMWTMHFDCGRPVNS